MFKLPNFQIIRMLIELIATTILIIIPYKFYRLWRGGPTKRGFFCDDDSLKYPYREDTITTKMLYGFAVAIPISIIIMGELIKQCIFRAKSVKHLHWSWKLWLMCHEHIMPFLFFMASEHLVSSVAKFSLGRLRPHFFAVCQPYRLADNSTCADAKNHGIYIMDYECHHPTNSSEHPRMTWFKQLNAHLSFPSGHSSLIFYGMLFTVLYLQRFSKFLHDYKLNFGLLLPLLQMLCVLLASFVAVSRVMDYKHHWSDAFVGSLLGSAAAIAATLYIRQQIKRVTTHLEGNRSGSSNDTSIPDTEMTFATTSTTTTTMPNPIIVR